MNFWPMPVSASRKFTVAFMLLLSVWCAHTLSAQNTVHVVVLGFDGMSGRGVARTHTPNLDSLKAHGAYTYKAEAVIPTVSSPNWASMINGAPPRKHKVFGNDWEREKIAKRSFCGQQEGTIFPTIFKVLRDTKSDAKIECVHDWDGFARLANTEAMDTCIDADGEYETCTEVCKLIKNDKPDFLFVHFDHVDHAGHAFGHLTEPYFASIRKADSLVGVVIQTLKDAGIYEDTYIIITADHGGIRKGHGGLTRAEIEIPWIISGPKTRQGFKITKRVKQYDTASTIAYLFGLRQPNCWKGKPIKAAFIEP